MMPVSVRILHPNLDRQERMRVNTRSAALDMVARFDVRECDGRPFFLYPAAMREIAIDA